MAQVNDASNVSREVAREWEKLGTANIDHRDRLAISRFVRHRRIHGTDSGSYSSNTERLDLTNLRLSAKRGHRPLVDFGIEDVNTLISTLQDKHGIGTGIDAYTRVLRIFFGWLDSHDKYGDYGFWEEVKTGNVDFKPPKDREFPKQDQIDSMKEQARRNNNPRNAALISFLADSAVRRTLAIQLRVGDIDLEGKRPTFRPNPEGEAQKDVEIKDYPLYESVSDLRVWINRFHPEAPNPPEDAPLFTIEGYDPENREECALSDVRLNAITNQLAEEAGIPENVETKPHAFRHAAIGRWKSRGYSLGQVQRRTAWKDSAAADMWGKYGNPDDEKTDSEIDKIEGQERDTTESEDSTPDTHECWNCGMQGLHDRYCPRCGEDTEKDPADIVEMSEEEMVDSADTEKLLKALAEKEGIDL